MRVDVTMYKLEMDGQDIDLYNADEVRKVVERVERSVREWRNILSNAILGHHPGVAPFDRLHEIVKRMDMFLVE